jgi:hypothetical protein
MVLVLGTSIGDYLKPADRAALLQLLLPSQSLPIHQEKLIGAVPLFAKARYQ